MYSTVPTRFVSPRHHDFRQEFPALATRADLNNHPALTEGYETSSFQRAANSVYSDAVLTSFGSNHSTFHEYDSPLFSSTTESMVVTPKEVGTSDADDLVSYEAEQDMMLSPDVPVKDERTSPPLIPTMENHCSNASTSMDEGMFESKRSSSTPAPAGMAPASEPQSPDGVNEGTWSASDKKLVAWRRQGISYKKILELGHFKEKESTLRGRYRTLIRPAAERPRNPQWVKGDVSHIDHGITSRAIPRRATDTTLVRRCKRSCSPSSDTSTRSGGRPRSLATSARSCTRSRGPRWPMTCAGSARSVASRQRRATRSGSRSGRASSDLSRARGGGTPWSRVELRWAFLALFLHVIDGLAHAMYDALIFSLSSIVCSILTP